MNTFFVHHNAQHDMSTRSSFVAAVTQSITEVMGLILGRETNR